MPVNFPLARLPSLALDNVIQIMEPIEQVILCQTSRKLKARVQRIMRNFTLYIEYNSQSETISFGHGTGKMSLIKPMFASFLLNNKKIGQVYVDQNGEAFSYKDSSVLPFNIYDSLAKTYEPQGLVYSHPFHRYPGAYYARDLCIAEERKWEQIVTISNCRKVSQTIWRNLSANGSTLSYIKNENADWMVLDDILLNFAYVDLFEIKVTNLAVNEFLMKWMRSEDFRLVRMVLTVHVDFISQLDIHSIADGLGAAEIEAQIRENSYGRLKTVVAYKIQRPDGRKVQVHIDGHEIWLTRTV